MRFFRLVILANYLLFGGLLAYAIGDLLLKNVWLQLFTIEESKPISVMLEQHKNQIIEIHYSFQVDSKTYQGSQRAFNSIADELLPSNLNDATISFNSTLPQVNWLDELDLRARTAYVCLFISSIWLTFVVLVDIFADKQKWINRYQKAFNS